MKKIQKLLRERSELDIIFFFIIAFIIISSYSSIIFSDYLYHDDWVALSWQKPDIINAIKTHHYYGQSKVLGRTIGHIFTAFSHYPVEMITDGKWVRLVNILLVSSLSFLMAIFLIRKCYYNWLFSTFFAVAFCTLPFFYQITAMTTGQYILVGLLISIIATNMAINYVSDADIFGDSRKLRTAFFAFSILLLAIMAHVYLTMFVIIIVSMALVFIAHFLVIRRNGGVYRYKNSRDFTSVIFIILVSLNIYPTATTIMAAFFAAFLLSKKHFAKQYYIKRIVKLLSILGVSMLLYYCLNKFYFIIKDIQLAPGAYSFTLNFGNFVIKISNYLGVALPKTLSLWFNDGVYSRTIGYFVAVIMFLGTIFSLSIIYKRNNFNKKFYIQSLLLLIVCYTATFGLTFVSSGDGLSAYRTNISHGWILNFLLLWSLVNFYNFIREKVNIKYFEKIFLPLVVFVVLVFATVSSNSFVGNNFALLQQYDQQYLRNSLIEKEVDKKILKGEKVDVAIKLHNYDSLKIRHGWIDDDKSSLLGTQRPWLERAFYAYLNELTGRKYYYQDADIKTYDNGLETITYDWGRIFIYTDTIDFDKFIPKQKTSNLTYIDFTQLPIIYER